MGYRGGQNASTDVPKAPTAAAEARLPKGGGTLHWTPARAVCGSDEYGAWTGKGQMENAEASVYVICAVL